MPWWQSERKELKGKVRRVEWRKRVGQEENDTSNPCILLRKKHIMGCSNGGVGFICSLITLVSSDVCIYHIQVFLQILKWYRYATNRIANVQDPCSPHLFAATAAQESTLLDWAGIHRKVICTVGSSFYLSTVEHRFLCSPRNRPVLRFPTFPF